MAEVRHRALFSCDVESSGDPRRDNASSVELRDVLFSCLESAFEASGIEWAACERKDTGDGMTVLVPGRFPKRALLHPLLGTLAALLRRHNRESRAATTIRLRIAIHDADVLVSDGGVTGRPLVLLARLLDAEPLRKALAAAPHTATVAALISDRVHEDVVAQGDPDIDPDLYSPVKVRVKETETTAWLHVPGHPGVAAQAPGVPSGERPAPGPPSGGVQFNGSGDVRIGGSVIGGDQHHHRHDQN